MATHNYVCYRHELNTVIAQVLPDNVTLDQLEDALNALYCCNDLANTVRPSIVGNVKALIEFGKEVEEKLSKSLPKHEGKLK